MSSYVFNRGVRLFLTSPLSPKLVELSNVSTFDFSQTIRERTLSRSSLFSNQKAKEVINSEFNVGSGSFSIYPGRELPNILSLMGFEEGIWFNGIIDPLPFQATLVVVSGTYQFKIHSVVISSIDIPLAPTSTHLINISFDFSSYESVNETLDYNSYFEYVKNPSYLNYYLNDSKYSDFRSGTFSISRQVNWTKPKRNQFDPSKVYSPARPVIQSLDITASLSRYFKGDDTRVFESDLLFESQVLEIFIPEAHITTRISSGEIYEQFLDIKYTPTNMPLYIRRKND